MCTPMAWDMFTEVTAWESKSESTNQKPHETFSFFVDKVKQCISLINSGYFNDFFLIAVVGVGRNIVLFWKGPNMYV